MENTQNSTSFKVVVRLLTFILCSTLFFSAESFCQEKDSDISSVVMGGASVSSANSIERTQVSNYRVMENAHGYAAEDANALNDRAHGHKVQEVGRYNASDGPDRIVDGQGVQTKYGKTASYNINTSFDKKTGLYRYDGQVLEVPKDQYEEAVKLMEEKIRQGKVPGYSDPADAKRLVRKGYLTYDQAVKVAKAGTIESIKFDVKTGAVTCVCAAGLTFTYVFIVDIKSGADPGDALLHAAKASGISGIAALSAHVITMQLLRCQKADDVIKALEGFSDKTVDAMRRTKAGKAIIDNAVTGMSGAGKQMTDAAIASAAKRMMSSNIVSSIVMLTICSGVDVAKGFAGKKAWAEVGENAVVNTAAIAGGSAGVWAGAALGSTICPGAGTAIGALIGGIAGGAGASALTKEIFSWAKGD